MKILGPLQKIQKIGGFTLKIHMKVLDLPPKPIYLLGSTPSNKNPVSATAQILFISGLPGGPTECHAKFTQESIYDYLYIILWKWS